MHLVLMAGNKQNFSGGNVFHWPFGKPRKRWIDNIETSEKGKLEGLEVDGRTVDYM
jgi:hypothetical protein